MNKKGEAYSGKWNGKGWPFDEFIGVGVDVVVVVGGVESEEDDEGEDSSIVEEEIESVEEVGVVEGLFFCLFANLNAYSDGFGGCNVVTDDGSTEIKSPGDNFVFASDTYLIKMKVLKVSHSLSHLYSHHPVIATV